MRINHMIRDENDLQKPIKYTIQFHIEWHGFLDNRLPIEVNFAIVIGAGAVLIVACCFN